MRRLGTGSRFAFLLTTTVLWAGFVPVMGVMPATAQTVSQQLYSFNIQPKPVRQALNDISRITGVSVVYNETAAASVNGNAVSGSMTREQALAALLTGTGLSWSFTNPGTVTVSSSVTGSFDAPVDANGATVLGVIDVTGSSGGVFSPDTPYETAGSSSYISGEKIERFRGTSVGDMLSGTPGVLNGDNRNSGALDVNIRGMQGQGRVPVIVDGAIQETTIYRGYSGVAGRTYIDPDLIGEAAIEKGPSAAADGVGAIGGVVRMNTITVDDIVRPDKNFGVRVKGGFNSNSSSPPAFGTIGGFRGAGNYPNNAVPSSFAGPDGMDRPAFLEPTGGSGSIAAGYRSEYVDLVGAYARRKNGNYHAGTHGSGIPEPVISPLQIWQDGELVDSPTHSTVTFEGLNRYRAGEEVLNTSQDNKSYLLKGTVRFDGGHELQLAYSKYDSTYGEMMPSNIIRGPGAFQGNLNTVEVDGYTAKYKWNPDNSDFINANVNLFYNTVESRINSVVAITDTFMIPTNYYLDSRRWGVSLDNTSKFDTRFGDVSLTYGGSFSHEDLSPGEGSNVSGVSGERDGYRRQWSGFVSSEYKPTDWLTLNASLRYSDYKSQDRSDAILERETIYYYDDNGTILRMTAAERLAYLNAGGSGTLLRTERLSYYNDEPHVGSGFAPIFSATVEPFDGIQFYGKYAEAIRLPSLFETTLGWSTATNRDYIDLDPERAKNWEFGVNVLRDNVIQSGDRLRFKANYFNNNVDDYITRIFTITSGAQYPNVNIDSASFSGFEISGSYDQGRFFTELGYTHYISTEFCTKPGQVNGGAFTDLCYEGGVPNGYIMNHIPPKDSFSLTLGGRFLEEKLTVGGRVTYIGKRPTTGLGVEGATNGGSGGTMEHINWKPYTLVDLFASYKVNETFQIDAAIDNVTDQYYMDTLTLGLMPSPGRTFRLNMTAKF